jgi:hypothetical protein
LESIPGLLKRLQIRALETGEAEKKTTPRSGTSGGASGRMCQRVRRRRYNRMVTLKYPEYTEGRNRLRRGEPSTEGESHLRRGRLVYGEGDSSTKGESRLRRGRLVYGGGDSSTEGVTRLQRARVVYEGEDSCTEHFFCWGNTPVENCPFL